MTEIDERLHRSLSRLDAGDRAKLLRFVENRGVRQGELARRLQASLDLRRSLAPARTVPRN